MPDTAEAVAQYGSAVYRLAYASFSGSTGPPRTF